MKSAAEIVIGKSREEWNGMTLWIVRFGAGALGTASVLGIYFLANILGDWSVRRLGFMVFPMALLFGALMTLLAWRKTKKATPPS